MTAPRVLVSDKLSKTAVQIFKDHGVEVDYQPISARTRTSSSRSSATTMVSPSAPPPR
ncbi:MAG: hypothetical protein WDM84_04560 [Bauldia sp.]